MTSKHSLTDEQTVAIILAVALASLWKPHHDFASFLEPLLGEVAGYVAGIGITALLAGLLGFVVFTVQKWFRVSGKNSI